MSNDLEKGKAFALGWLLGRTRRRRQRGASVALLIIGLIIVATGLPMVILGVPLSWQRTRRVKRYRQPTAAELTTVAPGTAILIAGQLPDKASPTNGLALYYAESRPTDDASADWLRHAPPPDRIELALNESQTLTVQLGADTTFADAERIETSDDGVQSRTIGYLPGQVLTVEGTWEGQNLITADALYPGNPDAYVQYLSRQPGMALIGGATCSGVGILLLGLSALLRLLGR